ncbi:MAG: hypothetical protein HQ510_10345 [Candidatus Marinimicrobia bacterium]|nr:hypothetical protein [Candidatus Neomarinimicrobiota bacterium]
MKTRLFWIIITLLVFQIAVAVPRFSLENGASCNLCHVNPTGGGMRNDYGTTIFALDELPRITMESEPWDGVINEHLKIGGEFRIQSLIHENAAGDIATPIFPMQADLTTLVTPTDNFSIYGNIRLSGGILNEFWAMVSGLPNESWVRVGRILPDYGLKLDDHTAFIRGGNIRQTHGLTAEGLFFAPTLLPTGIEAGTKIGNGIRLTGGISNAFVRGVEPSYGFSESISDKAFSLKVTRLKSYFEFVHTMNAISLIRESNVTVAGISGGISLNRITWHYEFDRVENGIQDTTISHAMYQELSYSPAQGLTLIGRYEFFDPDLDYASEAIQRIVAGVEVFPRYGLQYIFQVRVTRTDNIPGGQPTPEFLCQLHYWF